MLFFRFHTSSLLQVSSCTSVLPCYLLFLFFPAHQWLSRALLCGHPCMLGVELGLAVALELGSLIGLDTTASLFFGFGHLILDLWWDWFIILLFYWTWGWAGIVRL